ncbi:MAG: hypothetical protein FRX49_08748 [Trebouxia sp. A1-2]|nr:MAG: hypothetical protein FRX49_08748 [Trebouxia sp. A1-2]
MAGTCAQAALLHCKMLQSMVSGEASARMTGWDCQEGWASRTRAGWLNILAPDNSKVRAQRLPTAQRFGNEASGVAPTASKAKLKQQPSGCTVTADTDAADAAAVTGFNATLFGISGRLNSHVLSVYNAGTIMMGGRVTVAETASVR